MAAGRCTISGRRFTFPGSWRNMPAVRPLLRGARPAGRPGVPWPPPAKACPLLACTLNFGFFLGEIDRADFHHPAELFIAVVINLITLIIKFGDRTQMGATHLATSLVATLQLLFASLVWMWVEQFNNTPLDGHTVSIIVSLSGGALLANLVSVILLIGETLRQTR